MSVETNLPDGWLRHREAGWLRSRSRGSVLEIGSYHGRSTSVLVERAEHLWCVDSWDAPGIDERDYRQFMKNIELHLDRITVLRGDSHQVLDRLAGNIEFDFIFIDGGHDYERVHGDIQRALLVLAKGGILCGHDYNKGAWPGVVRAVNELVPNFQRVEKTSLWWWANEF